MRIGANCFAYRQNEICRYFNQVPRHFDSPMWHFVRSFHQHKILQNPWGELSQSGLYFLFLQLSRNLTAAEIMVLCLFKWAHLKVITRLENGSYLISHEGDKYELTTQQLCCAALFLNWIDELPTVPIQLKFIGKHKALPVDFEKVPFLS